MDDVDVTCSLIVRLPSSDTYDNSEVEIYNFYEVSPLTRTATRHGAPYWRPPNFADKLGRVGNEKIDSRLRFPSFARSSAR
jgi:hypothetical protein